MGIFDKEDIKESKIIVNFDTDLTDGHAVLVSTDPIKDKMARNRHLITGYPRDVPEYSKDYVDKLKQKITFPVSRGFVWRISGISEYKEMIFCLPNDIKKLPLGLPDVWFNALQRIVLETHARETTEQMLWDGITSREEILHKVFTMEFPKDIKQYAENWVDEEMDRYRRQLPIEKQEQRPLSRERDR